MSSADCGDAEVIALDDTAYIDEVVNESKSDPVVMAVKKGYISEVDFENVRRDNSPICSSVMSAHVVFCMEAYTTKYADRRHPEDSKMCLAFDSYFFSIVYIAQALSVRSSTLFVGKTYSSAHARHGVRGNRY